VVTCPGCQDGGKLNQLVVCNIEFVFGANGNHLEYVLALKLPEPLKTTIPAIINSAKGHA
jgi:hypothetical protein